MMKKGTKYFKGCHGTQQRAPESNTWEKISINYEQKEMLLLFFLSRRQEEFKRCEYFANEDK
jgi:predicted secreted hydrolase